MPRTWFVRSRNPFGRQELGKARSPSKGASYERRLLRIETLEARQMLSASVPGYATPNLRHVTMLGGVAAPLATSGPTGMTPQQIRHAYGFDQIAGDGTGTTIAIVDAYDDPNIANDLLQFNARFGLPNSSFTKVNQNGSTALTTLPAPDKGWATEIALDVEWAHAIAPGASILLVEANSASFTDLLKAVDTARSTPGVVAVSMSWGGGEFSGETAYDSHFLTPTGHTGVSFFVSSGDSGAPTSYPATSPNVVSVGGTSLYLTGGNYGSESGWSGSGGGISGYEAQPSYQNGVVTQSTSRRTNPDVAYDSDPSTGFPVYDTYNNTTAAPWGQWGGTSDAAPQFAALVAIADQLRAANGLGSLDGRTQLLPLLYSLPGSDFHDIVTGTSTGSPQYSATAGYDLVTGRGSPIANLLIRDLSGQPVVATPTHFSVVAAASTTVAGAPFSVTVTALDQNNNRYPNYAGTVHFTSTDTGAGVVLPADYTFTTADAGVHTFTSVKLVTAGSQTLTGQATSSTSFVGSTSITVTPAAVAKLVYGQQPTSTSAGVTISPAVTVRLLDAYNNLVTSDNTDKVSLALTGGTAGAVLSGVTTATAVGGVATFTNLAVNQTGTGYALVAKTGSLPSVTSASFSIATTISGVIEGFATTSLSAYTVVGARTPSANISSTAAHDGSYGLVDTNGNDWIYRNDAAAHVKAGDTISVWLKFASTAQGRAYLGFGSSATGTLDIVAAPNTNQLILQYVNFTSSATSGGVFTDLAAVTQTWTANQWYRLEVGWSTTGQIIGRLFAADGVTELNSVLGSQLPGETIITGGGIGFRAIGTGNKYWDSVQLTPSVNTFALLTGGSTGSGTSVVSIGGGFGWTGGWWNPWGGYGLGSLWSFLPATSTTTPKISTPAASAPISLTLSNPLTLRTIEALFAEF